MTFKFGKHTGMNIKEVPRDYLEYLVDSSRKNLKEYEEELNRRDLVEIDAQSVAERIVAEGFRTLAKKMHPDAGGSEDQFRELKAAQEQLKIAISVMKNG